MKRSVAVMLIDDLMVVVCEKPSEAYCSKKGKHVGFIVAAKIVYDEDTLSDMEERTIIRMYFALKGGLQSLGQAN